jgi:hypothetical protein
MYWMDVFLILVSIRFLIAGMGSRDWFRSRVGLKKAKDGSSKQVLKVLSLSIAVTLRNFVEAN